MLAQAWSWTLCTRFRDLDVVFLPAGTCAFEDLKRAATSVDLARISHRLGEEVELSTGAESDAGLHHRKRRRGAEDTG